MRTFQGLLVLLLAAASARGQVIGIQNVRVSLTKVSEGRSVALPLDDQGNGTVTLRETGTYRLTLSQKNPATAVVLLEARTQIFRPGKASKSMPHVLAVKMNKVGQLMTYHFDVTQPGTEFRVSLSTQPVASVKQPGRSTIVPATRAPEKEYAMSMGSAPHRETYASASSDPVGERVIIVPADIEQESSIPVRHPGIYELRFEQRRTVTAPYTFQARVGGEQMPTAIRRTTVRGPGVVWRERVKIVIPDTVLTVSVLASR